MILAEFFVTNKTTYLIMDQAIKQKGRCYEVPY